MVDGLWSKPSSTTTVGVAKGATLAHLRAAALLCMLCYAMLYMVWLCLSGDELVPAG